MKFTSSLVLNLQYLIKYFNLLFSLQNLDFLVLAVITTPLTSPSVSLFFALDVPKTILELAKALRAEGIMDIHVLVLAVPSTNYIQGCNKII